MLETFLGIFQQWKIAKNIIRMVIFTFYPKIRKK